MPSSWSDLDRPPLSPARLRAAIGAGTAWTRLEVVAQTTSTNADLAAAAAEGAPSGYVLFAEQQAAGRGRLDRQWASPPRAGLLLSVLLRPTAPVASLPLLSLLSGVAVVEAVRGVAGVPAALKWPNDVLVGGRKLAGLLVERTTDGAVVIGIGLNVTTRLAELPDERATSLALAGAGSTDRETILKAVLRSLSRAYASWRSDPAALVPAYRSSCVSIGKQVRVELPGGETYEGIATDVDADGRLIVGDRAFAAGDVVHLR